MAEIEKYIAPQTLEEATRVLAEGNVTVLAGGTDLVPQTQSGIRQFQPVLMNICRIPELKGVAETNGEIRIGALTTIAEIVGSPLLKVKAAVLADAADCFAGGQVRNSATLGGNICNASPAADMAVPLLLLGAEAELAGWANGQVVYRTVPLCDLFVGPGETLIKPYEVLTFVRFPAPQKEVVGVFHKFGTRPALDIAVVSVGISGVRNNGCLSDVRVAFGAVAPTPVRGYKTEAALEGATLDDGLISTIGGVVERDISPISDVRASAWYRNEVLCRITQRLLHDVRGRKD